MATVSKGRVFVSGETVTPAKLNELVDNATVTSIVDADVSASAAISLSKLATGALPTAITTTTGNIVDASVTPAKLSQPLTFPTAQASTSGTSIDFTGIPSWARRLTIIFNAVSTSGTQLRIRLGAGSVQTSGYNGRNTTGTTGWNAVTGSSDGFDFPTNGAAQTVDGSVVFYNPTGNTWVASGTLASSLPSIIFVAGFISLSGALDRVRITTVNGTDAFDGGTINIAYE